MENVIFRNICHEIMRECNNKGIKISEKFSAYYVKLLLLDPKWHIFLESEDINRIDLQNLVKYALQRLNDEFTPSVVALKMQMYFDCSFGTSAVIIGKHRQNLRSKLLPLANEIFATNVADGNEEDMEKLYKKIVYYLTLSYGLGNPIDPLVYKEARAALHSVFDMNDLKIFMSETQTMVKEENLKEVSFLLAGVRLFNRDCNKGGHGIEDIPMLLTEAIDVTNTDLQRTLVDVMNNVNKITTALDNSYKPAMKGHKTVLNLLLPNNVDSDHVEYAKDLLVCYRQFEFYIRKMLIEVEKMEDTSQIVFDEFQWCLIEVHKSVQYKTAVPANIVYPLFNKLASIWHSMLDMVIYLSKLHQILVNLQTYIKQIVTIDAVLLCMIGENPILTDADRLTEEAMYRVGQLHCSPLLSPSKIEDFESKQLQLLGFCAWKFVETQGALIPGNPNNGVVEHDGKYYVFSSLKAAEAFLRTPKRYTYEILDIARRKPELTHFLELFEQLEAVKNIDHLVTKTMDATITHNVEIQTDLHPETTMKDPKYLWNVWDLKRKALAMADISKRNTRSTQTIQSNKRNSIRTQTHQTKDHCYQTKRDNYSNVPTQSTYIFGLRGRKDDKQFIITLSRPVDEK